MTIVTRSCNLRVKLIIDVLFFNMARKKIENLSFEESLTELEGIVQNLETGELALEDAMSLFERGLNLSQVSQEKLKDADQKVQILMKNQSQQTLENYHPDENET